MSAQVRTIQDTLSLAAAHHTVTWYDDLVMHKCIWSCAYLVLWIFVCRLEYWVHC